MWPFLPLVLGHWSPALTPRPTPSAPLGPGPSDSGLITQPVSQLQTVGLLSAGSRCVGPTPLRTPDPGTAQGQTARGQHSNQTCGVQNLFPRHPAAPDACITQGTLSRSVAAKGLALHFPSDQGACKQR